MDQMDARTDLVATDGGLIGQNGNVRHDTRYVHLSWTSKPTTHSFNDIRLGWSRDDLLITDSPWLFPSTGALGILVAGASIGAPSMYPASVGSGAGSFPRASAWRTILTRRAWA